MDTIFGTHGILGPGTYSIPGVGPVFMFGDDGTGESFPERWEGACTETGPGSCTVRFDAPGSTDTVTVVYQWRPSYSPGPPARNGGWWHGHRHHLGNKHRRQLCSRRQHGGDELRLRDRSRGRHGNVDGYAGSRKQVRGLGFRLQWH